MKKILINGIILSQLEQITGIQRVCREIILRLDKLINSVPNIEVEYVYLKGSANKIINLSEFQNIKPIELNCKNSIIARLFSLPHYLKLNRATCICVSTELLSSKNHIASVYDVRPAVHKNYDSLRFRFTYRILLKLIKHNAKLIVTDSDYQKKQIIDYFKFKNSDRVKTIYLGWEHIMEITPNEDIFKKYCQLCKWEYFYSLGSLAPHKNFKWILEVARRNPNCVFAIAGGKNLKNWKDNIQTKELKNVIFLGYVSDEENKALMQYCKAFIHPSKYEGFGIPPLEALACGARIIISNATCLPEIYEDCAHYFDPDNYEVDLESILNEKVADPSKILQKCSWDIAAKEWFQIIKEEALR